MKPLKMLLAVAMMSFFLQNVSAFAESYDDGGVDTLESSTLSVSSNYSSSQPVQAKELSTGTVATQVKEGTAEKLQDRVMVDSLRMTQFQAAAARDIAVISGKEKGGNMPTVVTGVTADVPVVEVVPVVEIGGDGATPEVGQGG